MSAQPISGRVIAAQRPQAGAPVVALWAHEAVGATETDASGAFTLAVTAGRGPFQLLAKGRSDAIGLAHAEASPGETGVVLDIGPIHRLTVRAEGDVPDGFPLQLAPRDLSGLSGEQVSLLHAPVDGMSDSMLAARTVPADGSALELAVHEGTWLLYAALESAPDALSADSVRRAWAVERATLESGEELPAAAVGHLVEVRRPTTVVLHVRELEVT